MPRGEDCRRSLPQNPEEGCLLQSRAEAVLGPEHRCFFVHRVVDRLDLSAFEQDCEEEDQLK